MGKSTGFLEYERVENAGQEPLERIKTYREFHTPLSDEERRKQGARCMDCGVPFCQAGKPIFGMVSGCPLNNLCPEWNDMVYNGFWEEAADRLLLTNCFPEFTSRVCPALCEKACTCGLNGDPVTVKENEYAIIEKAFASGHIKANPPKVRTGKRVAVVGSGPSGLAAALQLNKRGHHVTVFEREDRVGGLLMYGIPNMKLEKTVVQRRVDMMQEEGVEFRTSVDVGKDISAEQLLKEYDAVILACGSSNPRNINADGRDADGIYYAVDFLKATTKSLINSNLSDGYYISAKYKNVIVIGGGDTGNDCMGTAVRQGARTVRQLEYGPRAPKERATSNLWPEWPNVAKTDYGQEEAIALQGDDLREWCADTQKVLLDDAGHVRGLQVRSFDWSAGKPEPVEGSEREVDAQLVLVACGFAGPEGGVFDAFGVPLATQGRPLPVMAAGDSHRAMRAAGKDDTAVYVAGDARTGSSLVVNAMADALKCAAEVASDLGL